MSILNELKSRSGGVCELCGKSENLGAYEVSPSDGSVQKSILICSKCRGEIENSDNLDEAHWNCLNESMWSEIPAVKVMAFRLLTKLGRQDLLDIIYLEDEERRWAQQDLRDENKTVLKDANGTALKAGDSVVILKDLDVKGAGFTAKRGTTVRNISIPEDVDGHIEGRVNGIKIFLKTEFLKKA